MKKLVFIVLVFTAVTIAQYKDPGFPTSTVKDGVINNSSTSSSLFGFLNSDNFFMRHTFDLSYSAFGGEGLAIGMYTNSMFLRLASNLNVQVDASIVQSPYSTLGKTFQNNISGIYLTKAEVNYKPWDNFSVSLQYRNLPFSYYRPWGYGGGYYNDLFYDERPFVR